MTHIQIQQTTRPATLVAFALLLALPSIVQGQNQSPSSPAQVPATAANSEEISHTRARAPDITAESTLDDYLAYAALNNPGLEAAFNRWKAALERITQVGTLPDPRFNYSYFIREVETRVGPQRHRVGLMQMFPWFGKLSLRSDAATAAASVTGQQYETAKLRLFDEVRQAFFELYYLGRAIAVTEENVELLSYLEEVARSRYEAGAALHADVIKAQVELDKLRDRLRTLNDVRRPATVRLNAVLNRRADASIPLPSAFTMATPPPDAHAMAARLGEANPELRGLDAMAERERTEIALARKEYYPDITLGVDYTQTDPARTPGMADSGKDPVMFGVSVNLPIWREKYRAGVREAQSRHNAARLERRDRENRLTTELELALFRFKDAERKISLYRDALIPKADESLRVIQSAFEAGKTEFLSLIDAERMLLEFQLTYERSRADREQALSSVQRLTGGDENHPDREEEIQP